MQISGIDHGQLPRLHQQLFSAGTNRCRSLKAAQHFNPFMPMSLYPPGPFQGIGVKNHGKSRVRMTQRLVKTCFHSNPLQKQDRTKMGQHLPFTFCHFIIE